MQFTELTDKQWNMILKYIPKPARTGWQEQGIWKDILSAAIKSAHKSGKLNLQKISVDSSTIPAKKGET